MKKIGTNTLRMATLALAAIGLLLALPLAAQKDFNQSEKEIIAKYKRARVHFLKGGEHLKKGRLGQAQKEADAALAVFPDYAEARLLLAEVGYQRGEYEEALKEIELAKLKYKEFGKLYEYSYLQYLEMLRGQRDVVEKHISDLTIQMTTATDEQARQQIQETIEKDKRTMDTIDTRLHSPVPETLDMPGDYHYIHGNILFKLKRFGEARDQYRAAVQADPRHTNAFNNLISIHFASGDQAGTLKLLEEAEANGVTVNEKLKKAILEKK